MKRILTIPLSELGIDVDFLNNQELREAVLADASKTGSVEKFVAEWIYEKVIKVRRHKQFNQDKLDKLVDQNYSYQQISEAIAKAWIDGNNHVTIKKVSLVTRFTKEKIALLFSALVTLVVVFTLIYIYKSEYSSLIAKILFFEPVLVFICTLIAWTLYKIIMFFWHD